MSDVEQIGKPFCETGVQVQRLHAAGYNIFGTSGTADFFTEHNVPCKVRAYVFSAFEHFC